jgi:hypothetical protein
LATTRTRGEDSASRLQAEETHAQAFAGTLAAAMTRRMLKLGQ